jgi:SpoVK/Ycf46/Vps4 family AAA+-type ATPase
MIRKAMARIHPLKLKYWLVSIALLGVYLIAAILLITFFPFPQTGPADYDQPGLTDLDQAPADGLMIPGHIVETFCPKESPAKVIFVPEAADHPIYAVYCPGSLGPASNFALFDARSGIQLNIDPVYKKLGVWKYVGIVKSAGDWGLGAGALIAICLLGFAEMRQRAVDWVGLPPETSRWEIVEGIAFGILSTVLPFVTVPIGMLVGWRLRGWAYTVIRVWLIVIFLTLLLVVVVFSDTWGIAATLMLGAAIVATWWKRFIARERLVEAFSVNSPAPVSAETQSPVSQQTSNATPPRSPSPPPKFTVISPEKLPNFTDVGGMETLKQEARDTVGLMLAFRDEAEAYKISWNGFLLHGPPGVGKSFIVRAIAGEFGLNFIAVSPSELTSSYIGESARLITQVFEFAHDHAPCLLFFDEFDSLAVERDQGIDIERRLVVNQLLRSLEETREEHEVIVAAATNDLEQLDPAVIRPGRFDYHLHIGYPDQAARKAILASQLADLPTASDIDLEDLARRLDGSSAADIAGIVRKTALDVFRKNVLDEQTPDASITQVTLLAAVANRGGRDRPRVGRLTWEEVILPEETKAELIEVQRMIEDPELGRTLGIAPPSGLLLYGPPGTGKTTIARVLASECRSSFYPVSTADILTMWYGESESNIHKLFERARSNRPSIIFIDELDALAQRRGYSSFLDSILTQLLNEIDGMSTTPGVFVIGATNRPDTLDPALLRGGRLSRQILIPLPDAKGRARLLKLMSARMPLAEGVNPLAYINATQGYSGADIEAFCQQAAQEALSRIRATGDTGLAKIEFVDFDNALSDYQKQRAERAKLEGE